MAWTKYQLFLAGMMMVTGSINTLATKWADKQSAVGSDNGEERPFDHPFLQAVGMFIGELSCLLAFRLFLVYSKYKGRTVDSNRKFNPLIFLAPAMCDMCGTSLMYIGLNMTFPSSFQMLRGAVIIFTALLSVAFLGRKIETYQWVGIFVILLGLLVVGLSDVIFSKDQVHTHDINGIIAGDLLIVMAQIVAAAQMVIEEKFVNGHNVAPLQAVGWEGFFGFSVLGLLLIPFYYINAGNFSKYDPNHRLENVPDAFAQMGNNHIIIIATVGNIVSIAFFNFSGISVTRELNAITRMVLDSARTVIIWVFSIAVGWQGFTFLQLAGFFLLFVGMCLYNDILITPFMRRKGWMRPRPDDPLPINRVPEDEEKEPLIQ